MLAEPLPPDPGQRLFEYDFDILSEVGVRLPREQQYLLDAVLGGGSGWAMTVKAMIDPGDRYRMTEPLFGWDTESNLPRPVVYPAPVLLDWDNAVKSEREEGLAREHNWWRFPSLPGRVKEVSPWWEPELLDIDVHRIWNLWPIAPEDVEEITGRVGDWMMDDRCMSLDLLRSVDNGDMDACDFATSMGHGDPDTHEHTAPEDGQVGNYYYEECITAQEAYKALETELYVPIPLEEDPERSLLWVKWFPPPDLKGSLQQAWERLLISSESNTIRATHAFPPWTVADLIESERWFTPWLWLS